MPVQGEKLNGKLGYRHFALVVYLGDFPIDCLRYDSAMPWKETDARIIVESMDSIYGRKENRVIVCRFGESATPGWSCPKWDSNGGVKIVPISFEKAQQLHRERDQAPFEIANLDQPMEPARIRAAIAELRNVPDEITQKLGQELASMANDVPDSELVQAVRFFVSQHFSVLKRFSDQTRIIQSDATLSALRFG